MFDDSVLSHPLLVPVRMDALLARHPWNPQKNETPIVHAPTAAPATSSSSILINGNSRAEQRTRLVGDTVEFRPYPATAADLDAMDGLVGEIATLYVLFKGACRQGVVRVATHPREHGVYALHLQPTPKQSWADMDDDESD